MELHLLLIVLCASLMLVTAFLSWRLSTANRFERALTNLAAAIDGRADLSSLLAILAQETQMRMVFAGELKCRSDVEYVQTMLFLNNGVAAPNFEYELKGTPCEKVRDDSQPEAVPKDVQRLFPLDVALVENNINSYIGCPLWARSGKALGLVVAMSDREMEPWQVEIGLALIKIIALKLSQLMELEVTSRASMASFQKLGSQIQELGHINSELRHEIMTLSPELRSSHSSEESTNKPRLRGSFDDGPARPSNNDGSTESSSFGQIGSSSTSAAAPVPRRSSSASARERRRRERAVPQNPFANESSLPALAAAPYKL